MHQGSIICRWHHPLVAHCKKQVEELLHAVEEAAAQVGLEVNSDKTKVMTINNTPAQIKTASGTLLKNSNSFKYLGSSVPDSFRDFKQRKALAWTAMTKLEKIWKSSVSRKCRLHFFHASVESILLYGAETWTITQEMEDRIDGCYTRLLRKALDARWQNHPTNQSLYQDLPKLSAKIKTRRLRFAGHCARNPNLPVSHCLFWTPQAGHTSRGRPITTYSKNLMKDTNLQDPTEILTLMRNKEAWEDLVDNPQNNKLVINPPTGDRWCQW